MWTTEFLNVVVKDVNPPTLTSVSRISGASETTGASSASFDVTFSKPVKGVTTANFAVAKGASLTGTSPTVQSVTSVSPSGGYASTWRVVVGLSGLTGAGGSTDTIGLTLTSLSTIKTSSEVAMTSATASGITENYKFNSSAPKVALTYSPSGPLKSGTQVTITATFDVDMSDAPTVAIAVPTGGSSPLSATAMTRTSAKIWTYPYTVGTGDGIATVSILGTGLLPAIANATATNNTFVVDNRAPTADLSLSSTASAFKTDASVLVTATFSEAMSTSASPTFSLSEPNSVSATAMTQISPTVWTYSHRVASGDGTATVSVTGTDLAGNPMASAATKTFVIDNTAPSVALSYAINPTVPANATAAAALTYASEASHPVKVGDVVVIKAVTTEATGLASPLTLTLSGSRALSPLGAYTASSSVGTTYWTHTVASGNDGTATVSMPTPLPDVAGNIAVLSGTTTFKVDTTPPAVALTFSDGGTQNAVGPYLSGDSVTVTAVFTEANQIRGTPTLTFATGTFTAGEIPSVTLSGSGTSYTGTFTVPHGDGTLTATVSATDDAGNVLTVTGLSAFTVDNTDPTFSSIDTAGVWYSAETPTFTVVFSEAVTGVASSSFTIPNVGAAITGGSPSISNVSPSTCSNSLTVAIGLNGATGTGEASSTFTLQFSDVSGITDCAGNDLSALTSQVSSGTFTLYPGSRPQNNNNNNSNSDPEPKKEEKKPVVPVVTSPVVAPTSSVAPPASFGTGTGAAATAQAFSSLSPEKAQALGAALSTISNESAQAFGSALGGAGAQAAAALLNNMASLPAAEAAAVASIAGGLPAGAAASFVATLASLPPDQLAAVASLAASLPPGSSSQVFSAIAQLSQPGGAPVSFAPPGKSVTSSSGQETVSFDLADETAQAASLIDSVEVAGVRDATSTRRLVVVLIKPGQVGRINRPKSGMWPDLALPVTSGRQAGLMPIFSIPADATSFNFEPTPGNLNIVQQGSLGGGTVIPLSAPFAVSVSAPDTGAEALIAVQMPSIPVAKGDVFAYLYSTGGGTGPGFAGYLRAPAEFDPPTGRQKWTLRVDEAADVLFMPVALRPAFVQNFADDAHIYSSPNEGAIDFGVAGPQFTTFTVVAPQVGYRIYVYNPETKGYGWIDARSVGPSEAPTP